MLSSLLLAAFLAASPAPPPAARPVVAAVPPAESTAAASGPTPPGWTASHEAAVQALIVWHGDPVAFVRAMFGAEPDAWQEQVLRAIHWNEVNGGQRVAMKACKGPGKSTVEAWAIWWFLYTRPQSNVIALSITGDNLKDGLWKELAKWYEREPAAALREAFEVLGERITHRQHPKTWWCSARQFAKTADKEQQAATIAGLHADHVMVVLDEVADYPPGVMPAAEAIFSVEGAEARLVCAGNPTRQAGPLWDIETRFAQRWWRISITGRPGDPTRAPRISEKWAQQQIDDFGIDNPYVKTNVLGEFPDVASNKLLGPEDVVRAEKRGARPEWIRDEPVIFGVDVARMGGARSVLYKRQGRMVWRPEVWRGLKTDELVDRIAALIVKHDPDAVFIDMGSFGAAIVDGLHRLGYDQVIGIDFAGKASRPMFHNKRAEMWWTMSHAVEKWLCLPPANGVLAGELVAPEFEYREIQGRTQFILESKEDLVARGVESPDEADALALTFARPVQKRARSAFAGLAEHRQRESQDYQPSIG